jgi:hypothetical protein
MAKEAPIEIARNKKNLAFYLAGGLIVLCIGLFLVIDPYPFMTRGMMTSFIIVATGLAIMVLSGIYCYILAVRMATVFPAMIISEEDIYDHTGSPADGLINWADVAEIKETQIKGKRYLSIIVKHPQTYIDRQRNPVKRNVLVKLHEAYGSPIQIAADSLDYDFEGLKNLMKTRLEKFRATASAR